MLHGSEIIKVSPSFQSGLSRLFFEIKHSDYGQHFHPHPLTAKAALDICQYEGKDFYCVLVKNDKVIGYGLLRGWDEGYEIPSLGIALSPDVLGSGYGLHLMKFLHEVAKKRGAGFIRLKVYKDNQRAISLYKKLGYAFQNEQNNQLLGIVSL